MNLIFFYNNDMDEYINTNFINVELKFIHCLKETGKYCIVPLKALLSLCICIETEDWVIACKNQIIKKSTSNKLSASLVVQKVSFI